MSCLAGPSKPSLLSSACQSVQHTDPRAPLRLPPPVEGDGRSVAGWALGEATSFTRSKNRCRAAWPSRSGATSRRPHVGPLSAPPHAADHSMSLVHPRADIVQMERVVAPLWLGPIGTNIHV